jgi:hypothetical protein
MLMDDSSLYSFFEYDADDAAAAGLYIALLTG